MRAPYRGTGWYSGGTGYHNTYQPPQQRNNSCGGGSSPNLRLRETGEPKAMSCVPKLVSTIGSPAPKPAQPLEKTVAEPIGPRVSDQ